MFSANFFFPFFFTYPHKRGDGRFKLVTSTLLGVVLGVFSNTIIKLLLIIIKLKIIINLRENFINPTELQPFLIEIPPLNFKKSQFSLLSF